MNAYSRMRSVKASKSRSMDFSLSDLDAAPPPEESPNANKIHEENRIKNPPQDGQEKEKIGAGVMRLKRNSSVSSPASSGSSSVIKHAVNRVFSMRRSSSVSEKYCRIHDQPLDLSSPFTATIYEKDDDDVSDYGIGGTLARARSVKHNKKSSSRAKILKTCKKLLGL